MLTTDESGNTVRSDGLPLTYDDYLAIGFSPESASRFAPPAARAPANSWEKWLQSQGMPLDTQPTEQLQQQYQGGQGGGTLLGGGSQPRTLTQQDFQF